MKSSFALYIFLIILSDKFYIFETKVNLKRLGNLSVILKMYVHKSLDFVIALSSDFFNINITSDFNLSIINLKFIQYLQF